MTSGVSVNSRSKVIIILMKKTFSHENYIYLVCFCQINIKSISATWNQWFQWKFIHRNIIDFLKTCSLPKDTDDQSLNSWELSSLTNPLYKSVWCQTTIHRDLLTNRSPTFDTYYICNKQRYVCVHLATVGWDLHQNGFSNAFDLFAWFHIWSMKTFCFPDSVPIEAAQKSMYFSEIFLKCYKNCVPFWAIWRLAMRPVPMDRGDRV